MDFDRSRFASLIVTAGAGVAVGFLGWKFLNCLRLVSADIGRPKKTSRDENIAPRIVIEIENKRKYFLKEMHMAKKCLTTDNYEEAANHFANAMLVTEKKENLDEVLVTALPKPIYEMFQRALKRKLDKGVVVKVCEKKTEKM